MSKYSQLPPDTIALLTKRASREIDTQDYVKWAVDALVNGFDSRSLTILATLEYQAAQTEAPDYFLKAVKELKLPIPDCELAAGNWYWTNSLYRKLGLSLPDETTLLGRHLAELAEQIKEGVIDPVIGLDRIYHEIVLADRHGTLESNTLGWEKRGRSGLDDAYLSEWDKLWSHIEYYDDDYFYDDNTGYHSVKREPEPNIVKQEIMAFATDWLANPETKFAPKYAIRKPLSEEEKKKFLQVKPEEQLPQQADHTSAHAEPAAFFGQQPNDKQGRKDSRESGINNSSDYENANEYMRTGLLYEQQGHYDLAIDVLNKSLEIYTRAGDQQNKALNYCNLGIAYEGLTNYPLAIEMYQKGLDIMKEIMNESGMEIIHGNFANIFKKLGNFNQAKNHYTQALIISERTGDQNGLAIYNFNLGQLYREMGHIPQASTHLRRAQELFELVGDKEKAQFTSRVLQNM